MSPGVYTEEIEIGARPIEGVSTNIAGMVGLTQKGPLNKPTLVTSFSEFQRLFGGYLDKTYGDYRYLPHALEGFFQNGGQRVYVNRVSATDRDDKTGRNHAGEKGGIDVVSDETIIGEDPEEPSKRTGLHSLENIDQISIIAIPNGTTRKIQNAMIAHCELLNDRFAVLDPIKRANLEEIQEQRSLFDSEYAALYYPWIRIRHPVTGEILSIPPSGHICGIYARSDAEHGVHKAPANEVIRGALGPDQQINKAQQSVLNPLGVNCLREFSGRGLHVWGARTTSNGALWRYINIRRLLLYLEKSIEEGTLWTVFEPNDENLWARVRQTIVQFLTSVWKKGALMGVDPKEAFWVKCDRSTMTQDDIDNGRLIVIVGVAPVKPSEFIIFRIAQWAGSSAVAE